MIRLIMAACLAASMYLFLVWGLWQEQLRYGAEHNQTIKKQSIRRIRIPGVRGKIFTRDMVPVADIRNVHSLKFHLSEMRRPGKRQNTLDFIYGKAGQVSDLIGRKNPLDMGKILNHIEKTPALPMTVFDSLNPSEIAEIAEIYPRIEGMEIDSVPLRTYPHGEMACHVLGYLGKEDPSETEDKDKYFYYLQDYVGRSGVEKICDRQIAIDGRTFRGLKATAGSSIVRVNTQGYIYETVETLIPPADGNSIVLTLDFDAQRRLAGLMGEFVGAMVVIRASTGEIMAMASSPGYDPSLFVPSIMGGEYSRLARDPGKPFINRAGRSYMPGSIIKPIIALAALDSGIGIEEEFDCRGFSLIGNKPVSCWRTSGHGNLALVDAIEQSCNSYFIGMGSRTGLPNMRKMFEKAGIGRRTGIELYEEKGLAPTEEYVRRARIRWGPFDTAMICIGQGYIQVTPLQAANYMAALANEGVAHAPTILKGVYDSKGNLVCEKILPGRDSIVLALDSELIRTVNQGLYQVVNGEDGTGKRAFCSNATIYGKTGTAEVGEGDNKKKNTWMAGFAEKDGERYSFAVVVERGISGGTTCAPIVKSFFNGFFD